MSTLAEFLDMGGYAFYVWTAYGVATAVLLANLVTPIQQRKKLIAEMRRKARRAHREERA